MITAVIERNEIGRQQDCRYKNNGQVESQVTSGSRKTNEGLTADRYNYEGSDIRSHWMSLIGDVEGRIYSRKEPGWVHSDLWILRRNFPASHGMSRME
jgi:hypothetical protein